MSNRSVKPIVAAVALLAIATFFLVGYLQHPRPSFAEGVQFIQALHKYAESREQRGQPRPASVEVRELVEGGLVSAKDARWFEGSKVTFTVITNLSANRKSIRSGWGPN